MTINTQIQTGKRVHEYRTKTGISKNRKHTIAKYGRRIVPASEWTSAMQAIQWQTKRNRIQGDVALMVQTPKNRRMDPSNYVEFFQDAFEKIWYENDRQVRGGIWFEGVGDEFIIRAKPLTPNFNPYILNAFETS